MTEDSPAKDYGVAWRGGVSGVVVWRSGGVLFGRGVLVSRKWARFLSIVYWG